MESLGSMMNVGGKFDFSKEQVVNVANKIALMIAQEDNCETEVHNFEFDEGRGAGFDISIDGEEFEGGSYIVNAKGEVINAGLRKVYGMID